MPSRPIIARMKAIHAMLFFSVTWVAHLARGDIAPYFGAEFTFTNQKIIAEKAERNVVNKAWAIHYQKKLAQKIASLCAKRTEIRHEWACSLQIVKNEYGVDCYKVLYADGFWLQISTDPSVVEVQMQPVTLEQARQLHERVQGDLFDQALMVGLKPHEVKGAGHIHLDVASAFQGDSLLFRNFLVDFARHPTLGLRTFNQDACNAPPIALLGQEKIDAFTDVIEAFDQAYPSDQAWSIQQLAKALSERVYDKTLKDSEPAEKYQALNVTRIVDPKRPIRQQTLEIRAIRPQKNFRQFILLQTLFQARLNYLKNNYSAWQVPNEGYTFANIPFPRTDKIIADFEDYIAGQGLALTPYFDFIPADSFYLTPYRLMKQKALKREGLQH